jgi:hypothetical protein
VLYFFERRLAGISDLRRSEDLCRRTTIRAAATASRAKRESNSTGQNRGKQATPPGETNQPFEQDSKRRVGQHTGTGRADGDLFKYRKFELRSSIMTDKRIQQDADNSNTSKHPDEWVTGR